MSIQELVLKFKGYATLTEYLLGGLIIIVSLASFFLGRASINNSQGSIVADTYNTQSASLAESAIKRPPTQDTDNVTAKGEQTNTGGYVASKNGTKYHLPWCGSAQQIKEENKIWFATKEEAEKAGYTPAGNCKGI